MISGPILWALELVGLLAVVWLGSHLVSSLRTGAQAPEGLYWSSEIPVEHVDVDGTALRYVVAGEGPPLVLLHTLRTQLDLFQYVLPELTDSFRVYAFDYPGHGWSDTPRVDYAPPLFQKHLRGFLDQLDLEEVHLVGASIGAPIALQFASERPDRVRKVVAVNSYDYAEGRGIERGSLLSRVVFRFARLPVVGETVMRYRFYRLFAKILEGSCHDPKNLPEPFVRDVYRAGTQPYRYRAFLSLVRHFPAWESLRSSYGDVEAPVLLVYGAEDWSRPDERRRTENALSNVRRVTVPEAGHFLSLEEPESLVRETKAFLEGEDHTPIDSAA